MSSLHSAVDMAVPSIAMQNQAISVLLARGALAQEIPVWVESYKTLVFSGDLGQLALWAHVGNIVQFAIIASIPAEELEARIGEVGQ